MATAATGPIMAMTSSPTYTIDTAMMLTGMAAPWAPFGKNLQATTYPLANMAAPTPGGIQRSIFEGDGLCDSGAAAGLLVLITSSVRQQGAR
ncbi:hypothetical protein JCM18899A_47460 [Nocardioides sp. AN3]